MEYTRGDEKKRLIHPSFQFKYALRLEVPTNMIHELKKDSPWRVLLILPFNSISTYSSFLVRIIQKAKGSPYQYRMKEEITMSDHPIQGLMQTAMENIKGMVDVNTIVGDPVQTPDGSVILPISKVAFGFAAGGSDFRVEGSTKTSGTNDQQEKKNPPFGGGTGGGVSIRPIAFLVVGKDGVYILPLDCQTHIYEKMIDTVPYVMEKIQEMFQKKNPNQQNKANYSSTTSPTGEKSDNIVF